MKSQPGLTILILVLPSALNRAAVSAESACDESKCRATRTHPWVDGATEWTCWVPVKNSTEVSSLCAEGFEGRVVQDAAEMDGTAQVWITCCPPEFEGALTRQCSDHACSSPDWEGGGNCWADGFQEPMSCSSTKYRYPRWTGLMSLIYLQYVCCTSPAHNDNIMEELLVARVIWIVLSSITLSVCLIFICSIVSDKRTRIQGYNLYLVFLAIPDALANLFILVRNSLTISGAPVSPTVHIFLASVEYFYAAANMWLNGLIVGQIHHVLRKSNKFVKIPPPSVSHVCKQSAGIYVFASGWFGWAFFLYYRGLVLFPLDQVVNIWIVTRVFMVAPPLCYVIYVCVHVWRRKLLPRSGRTRVLSLYFLRVVIVFLVTWVPYFIIYEIAWNVTHSRWMVHISYYLGSVQGLMSVVVALSKPDIKRAVFQFVSCGQKKKKLNRSRPRRVLGTSLDVLPPPETSMPPATTLSEVTWHQDEVRVDMRENFRGTRARTGSTIFNQSQNEWNMDDVWNTMRGDHDIADTEGNVKMTLDSEGENELEPAQHPEEG